MKEKKLGYCNCPKKPGMVLEVEDVRYPVHADCGLPIGPFVEGETMRTHKSDESVLSRLTPLCGAKDWAGMTDQWEFVDCKKCLKKRQGGWVN